MKAWCGALFLCINFPLLFLFILQLIITFLILIKTSHLVYSSCLWMTPPIDPPLTLWFFHCLHSDSSKSQTQPEISWFCLSGLIAEIPGNPRRQTYGAYLRRLFWLMTISSSSFSASFNPHKTEFYSTSNGWRNVWRLQDSTSSKPIRKSNEPHHRHLQSRFNGACCYAPTSNPRKPVSPFIAYHGWTFQSWRKWFGVVE